MTRLHATFPALLLSFGALLAEGESFGDGSEIPPHPLAGTDGVRLTVESEGDDVVVYVAADDRPGLLAAVAGVLSLNRLAVRAATVRHALAPFFRGDCVLHDRFPGVIVRTSGRICRHRPTARTCCQSLTCNALRHCSCCAAGAAPGGPVCSA